MACIVNNKAFSCRKLLLPLIEKYLQRNICSVTSNGRILTGEAPPLSSSSGSDLLQNPDSSFLTHSLRHPARDLPLNADSRPVSTSRSSRSSLFDLSVNEQNTLTCYKHICTPRNINSYDMPTSIHHKRAPIKDPLKVDDAVLPSLHILETLEKLDPGLNSLFPVQEPPNETTVARKEAHHRWMLRVRHKKMKKHQLKKLRKRMKFVMRKMRVRKAKRKEARIQAYEKKSRDLADEFDPEKYITDMISEAKKGGWKVDLYDNRR